MGWFSAWSTKFSKPIIIVGSGQGMFTVGHKYVISLGCNFASSISHYLQKEISGFLIPAVWLHTAAQLYRASHVVWKLFYTAMWQWGLYSAIILRTSEKFLPSYLHSTNIVLGLSSPNQRIQLSKMDLSQCISLLHLHFIVHTDEKRRSLFWGLCGRIYHGKASDLSFISICWYLPHTIPHLTVVGPSCQQQLHGAT